MPYVKPSDTPIYDQLVKEKGFDQLIVTINATTDAVQEIRDAVKRVGEQMRKLFNDSHAD